MITGATGDIGREAALALGAKGAHLVLAVRDVSRGETVARDVEARGGTASVVHCDLASFASVRSAAETIAAHNREVDVLANNAGLIASRRELTEDGNELTFQVDHLSHFLLVHLLREPLWAARGHVINVSSDAHLRTFRGFHFKDPGFERGWSPFRAYSQAKLANVLFTYELARRWAPLGIRANAMHPGVVDTGFGSDGWGIAGELWERFVPKVTAAEGARTLVWLASDGAGSVSGRYFFRCAEKRSAPVSYRLDDAARLWELSERLVGL